MAWGTPKMQRMTSHALARWTLAVAAVAGFHAVEHAVQAVQKYGTHTTAHGILGAAFDNDPMHFAFNWALFFALVPVLHAGPVAGRAAWTAFGAGFALQSYHVVEHSVKLAQFLAGADPAFGILGYWVPLVPLHLAINTAVYGLVAPHLVLAARPLWAGRRQRTPAHAVARPLRAP